MSNGVYSLQVTCPGAAAHKPHQGSSPTRRLCAAKRSKARKLFSITAGRMGNTKHCDGKVMCRMPESPKNEKREKECQKNAGDLEK